LNQKISHMATLLIAPQYIMLAGEIKGLA